MKIHGVRIYPQSVDIDRGADGTPIFIHGGVNDECSDFFYIFRPLASLWRGHFFADDFTVGYNNDGTREDPIPERREHFGPGFYAADLDSQLMGLRGDDFATWGPSLYFCQGAFLPVFPEPPAFDLLNRLCWGRDFRLTSEIWPCQMKAVLHMWNDIYWQLFSTDRSDIDLLVRAHVSDPKLEIYYVDFDREYPDPSNEELQPVAGS